MNRRRIRCRAVRSPFLATPKVCDSSLVFNVVRMIIDSLNGSTFKDYMLAVTCLLTPEELEEAKTRTVIIRGLDEEIPFIRVENEIKYMSYSATVFPNFSYNGSFSGSYSVVCKDEETALAFVNNLNNQEFLGRTVNCYLYSSSFKRTIQLNLHIRNFPMTWTTEDLKKYCGRFGDVNSCIRVQKTENYVHGFVSYFNKESVERALNATEKEVFNNNLLFTIESHGTRI